LLRTLEALEFRKCRIPEVRVIVVDNDPRRADGIAACKSLVSYRWPLTALTEGRQGTSIARNRAIEVARACDAELVAFIDDDEVPEPSWLDELLHVQNSMGVEGVSGPVLPHYEEPVPEWVVKGKFFERPRFATGTILEAARTGNLLLTTSFLVRTGLAFDAQFGLSGGEDTLLTQKLASRGFRIVWADSAIVQELVPRNRATVRWILRRAFAGGNNWTRIVHELKPGLRSRVGRFIGSLGSVSAGLLLLIPSIFGGRHLFVRTAVRIARGLGGLFGLLGWQVEAYGRES
jgi:cellulose synthase/poly-beta-1,6-N-acetylglucosamine synthase-like glycosyltransferase